MKDLIEDINRLEDYLINESEISLNDIQNISTYLASMRENAINYTRCCETLPKKNNFIDLLVENVEHAGRDEGIFFADSLRFGKESGKKSKAFTKMIEDYKRQ